MTEGLEGTFFGRSTGDEWPRTLCAPYRQKKDVLYTPFFWRWIMLVIKSIPERIFKRLKL